ncbi:MAG TPA: hypothetical protein PKA74_03140 [Bauldia sp.]|nr:hypothetical protein [Bauldia sp.]
MLLSVGILLVPIGIIIAPLPGPGGIPVIATGIVLIISSSRRAASWVRLHRRKWDWMHEILEQGEGFLGNEFGHALKRTNRRRVVPRPPLPVWRRVVDFLLFPVYVALIILRSLGRRFGLVAAAPVAPQNRDKSRVD